MHRATWSSLSLEEALQRIVEGTEGAAGGTFFRSLVRHLAGALRFRYALVGELLDNDPLRVRSLAYWAGDGFNADVEYELAGTPCEHVHSLSLCHFPSDVWMRFPNDHLLRELGIESYMGVALRATNGQVLGILNVMHDQPVGDEDVVARSLLTVFGGRAAIELERQRTEQALHAAQHELEQRLQERTRRLRETNVKLRREIRRRRQFERSLRESEQRYRLMIEQSPLSIQIAGHDGRILQANRAWEELWGVSLKQIEGYNLLEDEQLVEIGAMPYIRQAFQGQPAVVPPVKYDPGRSGQPQRERWTRTFIYPVKDPAGQVREVVLLQEDITAQVENAQALQRSEQHHREAADTNRRLLMEVDHRVRNNLAGLLSLIELMRQKVSDATTFANAIEGRLTAMVHVHQMLTNTNWGAIGLATLVQSLLSVMQSAGEHGNQVHVDGPPVAIPSRQAVPLAMTLLEWFTNSTKYGAHSVPTGRLCVTWTSRPSAGGQELTLRWREQGGPPVTPPQETSLGTELIHSFVSMELHGRCELNYPPDGADHQIVFVVHSGDE